MGCLAQGSYPININSIKWNQCRTNERKWQGVREFYLLMMKRLMRGISKSGQPAFQCGKQCVLARDVQGEAG